MDGKMQRFIREVNTTSRSCVLWDLEEETDYTIQVQSIGLYGESQACKRVHFRTLKKTDRFPSNSSNQGNTLLLYNNIILPTFDAVHHSLTSCVLKMWNVKQRRDCLHSQQIPTLCSTVSIPTTQLIIDEHFTHGCRWTLLLPLIFIL